MKLFPKVLTGIFCFTAIISITVATASWAFADLSVESTMAGMDVEVRDFFWEGAEVLPEISETGENHRELLDTMIKDLNSDNSVLEKQIEDRKTGGLFGWYGWDTYGSMDTRDDDTLSQIFNLDTQGLDFLIYFPKNSPNVRYIFTTSVNLGTSDTGPKIPIGTNVYPIYCTTIELNDAGEWDATKTELGYAPSDYYSNDLFGDWIVKCPSFDQTKWKAGKLGTSTGNAIYAYVGLNTTAYVDNETEQTYYALTCARNTTYTVTSTNANCTIVIIYNNKVQYTSSLVDGKQTVSFKANSNATYYIRLSGAKDMPFTIS